MYAKGLSAVLTLALATAAFGEPVITSVHGRFVAGQEVTLGGVGFGEKSPARPVLFADFASSIEPSSMGALSRWDLVENMQHQADCPGMAEPGCAASVGNSGVWTMMVKSGLLAELGARAYVYRVVRKNFAVTDYSQNWKVYRSWADEFRTPDLYVAENIGRIYTENPPAALANGYWAETALRMEANVWSTEEFLLRTSSAPDVGDGLLRFRRDGREMASGPISTHFSAIPRSMLLDFVVHFVKANASLWTPQWSDSNRVWVDDVYVDRTWARVMLGNAPRYGDCSVLVPQLPLLWSDGSITVRANLGGMLALRPEAFAYVIDADGNVNAVGYPVYVAGVAPAAPRNLTVK